MQVGARGTSARPDVTDDLVLTDLAIGCRATFRTWERLDPGDACRGRRPDEPRRVLGRPRARPSLLESTPPPVEIRPSATSLDPPAEPLPDELYPPEDWGEELARAVRESQRKLGVLGEGG